MQRRVAIWILGAFKTSLTEGIEALIGLIPIKSHVQKLGGRSQLHVISLPPNHIIRSLIDSLFSSDKYHHSSLHYLLFIQNFLLVQESLIFFLIVFLLILVVKEKITKIAFINLTQ